MPACYPETGPGASKSLHFGRNYRSSRYSYYFSFAEFTTSAVCRRGKQMRPARFLPASSRAAQLPINHISTAGAPGSSNPGYKHWANSGPSRQPPITRSASFVSLKARAGGNAVLSLRRRGFTLAPNPELGLGSLGNPKHGP